MGHREIDSSFVFLLASESRENTFLPSVRFVFRVSQRFLTLLRSATPGGQRELFFYLFLRRLQKAAAKMGFSFSRFSA
jgi:hypothetical protein